MTPEHDTRPVFGYVRVSTNRQEVERQEQTIPARFATLPDGLSQNELVLFDDHGVSAWSGKTRPGFQEMYERIQAGEASALIIDTSSRLTRQGIEEALRLFFTFKTTGTRLFTTSGGEYPFDLGGIIRLIVDAEGDERYSANLSHNIATGKTAAVSKGRWHHGDAPPGYRFDRDTKQLVTTDDLRHMAEAFRRFVTGASYRSICDYLTTNLSRESLVRRKNSRADVQRDRLRGWLANPIYVGMIQHRGELYDGTHTPAVDLPTFEAAQRRLHKNASQFATREPRSWPFSGIAKCGFCRHSLRLHPVTNRHGRRYYYTRCSQPDCARKHSAYTAAAMEANIVTLLAATAQAVELILHNDPSYGSPDSGPSPEEAQDTLRAATDRVKELGSLIADGAIDRDDPRYLDALNARDTAQTLFDHATSLRASYRDELTNLTERVFALADSAHPSFRRMADDEPTLSFDGLPLMGDNRPALILAGWQQADYATRRQLIEQTLEAVYVSPDQAEIRFHAALPVPLVLNLITAIHGRNEDTPALEAAGYGRPFRYGSPEETGFRKARMDGDSSSARPSRPRSAATGREVPGLPLGAGSSHPGLVGEGETGGFAVTRDGSSDPALAPTPLSLVAAIPRAVADACAALLAISFSLPSREAIRP